MILSIHLSHLRNVEFVSFMNLVRELVIESDNNLDLKTELGQFSASLDRLNATWKNNSVTKFTSKMKLADKDRVEAFTGLHQCVKGFSKHFDPAIRAAAQKIKRSIESKGKRIVYRNYHDKSNIFRALTELWKNNADYTAAFQVLSLSNWLFHLEKLNREFNQCFSERVSAKSALPKDKMVDLRLEITSDYRMLLAKIEAYKVLGDKNAAWLCKYINRLVKDYSKEIHRRENKSRRVRAGEDNGKY